MVFCQFALMQFHGMGRVDLVNLGAPFYTIDTIARLLEEFDISI